MKEAAWAAAATGMGAAAMGAAAMEAAGMEAAAWAAAAVSGVVHALGRDRHRLHVGHALTNVALRKARGTQVRERIGALAPRADEQRLVLLFHVGEKVRRAEGAVPCVDQWRKDKGKVHAHGSRNAGVHGRHENVVVRILGADKDGALFRGVAAIVVATVGAIPLERADEIDRGDLVAHQ